MKIIVDTNRIIAALIKEGISREILLNDSFEFFTPDFTLSELNKYEKEIIKKAKITHEEFEILISLIFERIEIVPYEEYSSFLGESKKLISDVKDVPFIALCLALKAGGIWSNDAHFQEQNKIKIFETKDLMNLFKENKELNY